MIRFRLSTPHFVETCLGCKNDTTPCVSTAVPYRRRKGRIPKSFVYPPDAFALIFSLCFKTLTNNAKRELAEKRKAGYVWPTPAFQDVLLQDASNRFQRTLQNVSPLLFPSGVARSVQHGKLYSPSYGRRQEKKKKCFQSCAAYTRS